ncbi:unnamed protein product [Schistosoma rodhaini]|uniref:MutL C-terminal dimerisation domain-containing protein n=1 Tax=Schistosoma rodhaini TaxID=6188 RepID=A0AA85FLW6_9TREM|nr:unnamed protein product [Schistosoma rodhaini]
MILRNATSWYCTFDCLQKPQCAQYILRNMLSLTAFHVGNDVYCLTVDNLRQARVVGQFDKKFILLIGDARNNHYQMFEELFSKNPGHRSKHSYIIAVDQHAAHERILLERFEKECLDYFEVSQNRAIQEPQFLKIFSNKISLKLSRQLVPDIFNFLNQEPDKLCCLLKYGFSAILDSNSMGQFIFVTMIPRKNHYKLYSSYIVKQRGHKCQYHAPHQGNKE